MASSLARPGRVWQALLMRICQLNHCVYQILYHIVFATKYRRKILKDYTFPEIIKSIRKLQKKYPDWYIHKINTANDHVHILIEIPPSYTVSEVVQKLKSQSSGDLKRRFKYIREAAEQDAVWSVGYFVSTIGFNEEIIRKYIEKQSIQDRSSDITQEFS